MPQAYEAALSAYERFEFSAGRYTRPVYMRGEGPAVVVIHEIPGLHPLVIGFADRIAAAGMSVYLPVLFGDPGRPVDGAYLAKSMFSAICVRREFNVWRLGRSSPIVGWLRALAKAAHEKRGGRGVGAVGMCFTGGFALAMATEPAVVAPVLAQPSLPIAMLSKARAADIDMSARRSPACGRASRTRTSRPSACASEATRPCRTHGSTGLRANSPAVSRPWNSPTRTQRRARARLTPL